MHKKAFDKIHSCFIFFKNYKRYFQANRGYLWKTDTVVNAEKLKAFSWGHEQDEMFASTSIQHYTEVLATAPWIEKKKDKYQKGSKTLILDNMVIYIENPKGINYSTNA